MNRCPTCNSPTPARHPAVQFEGQAQVCADPFHAQTEDGRRALASTGTPAPGDTEWVVQFGAYVPGRGHHGLLEGPRVPFDHGDMQKFAVVPKTALEASETENTRLKDRCRALEAECDRIELTASKGIADA